LQLIITHIFIFIEYDGNNFSQVEYNNEIPFMLRHQTLTKSIYFELSILKKRYEAFFSSTREFLFFLSLRCGYHLL